MMNIRRAYRAQFWSFDALFAMIIFVAAITILSLAWFNISTELSLSSGSISYIMQLQSQAVAQNIVSAGSPQNWQSIVNLSAPITWERVGVGLASSQGSSSLSPAKLYALQSMVNSNYSTAGLELGTDFNYYITIDSSQFNVTMGMNPVTSNSVTTFLNRKSAYINGVPVEISVYIWSGSTSSVT